MAGRVAVEGLSKSFDRGQTQAVDRVSLEVPPGQFLALVGASGSGKTTLLKMINRLIEPDGGRVTIDGRDVDVGDGPTLRRGIGYVFQGAGLFPHLTVAENVAVTLRLLGQPREEIDSRVRELLTLVDLPEAWAERRPAGLSGGERQRVAFARALAARPALMLLDEPFGALDALSREGIAAVYRDLHLELGLTSAMVTHDIGEALLLADRIGVMRDGRLLALGSPAELMDQAVDPYVRQLIDAPRQQAARIAARFGASPEVDHG